MNILDTVNQLKRIKRTGLVDTIKGVREPDAGVEPVPAEKLRKKLLKIDGGLRFPLEVIEGKGGKEGDLLARWCVRDAHWWTSFRNAHTNMVTELHMVLDEATHEVRAKDHYVQVRWNGNVPKVGGFSTKKPEFEREGARQPVAHGPDPLNPERERQYMLDTNELKELIGETITRAGWTYRQVYRKKTLAGE
ncbi:MAG: hypothetical protein FJW86_07060 [Actinobacteria bacterium]|nr:hypothetical protein [Actinomycetota bacterium]